MKFSFVMPAYNSEKTIAESIDTVLAQTYPNWELIVVNDGSKDSTLNIVEEYVKKDSRVRVFSQENAGTAAANNFGISQSSGDFVTIFPSDDWLLPNYLSEFFKQITQNPDFDIYFANGWFVHEEGYEVKIINEGLFDQEPTFIQVINTCPCSLGAMVRQGIHSEVGWYRKERYTEDYDFWLRAANRKYKFYFFDIPLVKVRISKTQKSANRVLICESDIQIMNDLLTNDSNSVEVETALKKRIRQIEKQKKGDLAMRVAIDRDLQISAQNFESLIVRVVGEKRTPSFLKAIHRVSFIVRPFRKMAFYIKALLKKK